MRSSVWLLAAAVSVIAPVSEAAQNPPSPRPGTEEAWEIPQSAKEVRNPVTRTDEGRRAGRALWRAHCETCHGVLGKGDGPSARLHELRKNVAPRDLTDPDVQQLADGEIFWRITNGYIDGDNIIMPAYRNKAGEQQRWQLVNYVRELQAARK